jgi:hypothetical protein
MNGTFVLAAAALLGATCGSPTLSAPQASSAPASASVRDDSFLLQVSVDHTTYHENEPITPAAVLTYLGPAGRATAYGSGGGLVSFSIQRLDGALAMSGAITADCAPHQMTRSMPIAIAYQKSGGFSDTDPNAAFWRSFFADKQLRLPVGTWQIKAALVAYLGDGCSPDSHELETAVSFEVIR